MSINVTTAREIRSRRRDAENVVFERLWITMDAQIRIVAGSQDGMYYRVPDFKLGLPRYDPIKVATRMKVRLRNRGFTVRGEEDVASFYVGWPRPPKPKKPADRPRHTQPSLDALASMNRQVQINKALGWD